jgi:hypothetical protein
MKKTKFLVVSVLLVSAMMLACQHLEMQSSGTEELKPCQISVPIVETIYAGQECVCFSPIFECYNPNGQGVYLNKFSYELDVGDFYFSGQQIPVYLYIPPGEKASFSGALPAAWAGMSLWLMQIKGVSMAQGMQEVVPLWKAWGGKLFNPKLEEVWKKAEAKSPVFSFKGKYEIASDGVSSSFSYETSYAMP